MIAHNRPKNHPLEIGGTPVDNAIMDLIALSELAEKNPFTSRALKNIVEAISSELSAARDRK